MPQHNIFHWRGGRGWLVLSGGGSSADSDAASSIEAHMLGRTTSQGPLAYIWAASDIETADQDMDALRELGARTGYLVDILSEDDETLSTQLSEAGVIILGNGPQYDVLHDALPGVVMDAIASAFERGATVYAIGRSAMLFGAFSPRGDAFTTGLTWLAGAIIMANYKPENAALLRDYVHGSGAAYGLGLGHSSAIAFGPSGEVEVWGNRAITVTLSERYAPGSGR